MHDELKPMEQIVWACAFAQSCNHVFADMIVERYRDAMQHRLLLMTAPKKSARAVDGEQREGTATTSIAEQSAGLDSAPVHGEAGSRGPREILEDIGFLPRRPADPEDQDAE